MSADQTNDQRLLLDRLFDAQVASCSCLTKTPDMSYHDPMCRSRLFSEAWETLRKVYEAFQIGELARTPSTLMTNIENLRRRGDCLDAIEREFFTDVVKGEDGEDGDECALSWGVDPAEYVEQFGEALTALDQSHE